ncbi:MULTISPECIES: hypothetical protein [unclassified Rhizobium]|uniref:hypothetical protein n=1 Tax=unclassified Rhizobium TaxID=2613769 RepID=UPI001602F235|nr:MULTISPECIES: hypothetical protein [unclassified Rhizobium]MBB1250322.1 hypothetical protein [Rhizobium sp. G21]MCV3764965.1 hypothetical protein [Rhizobium sp. TRM95796]
MTIRFIQHRTGRHAASPRLAWTLTKIEIRRNTPPVQPRFLAPDAIDLPLPKPCHQQMCVPASINGADLTNGRP